MPRQGPTYTREEARAAVDASRTYTEALRRLGMCPTGGAHPVLKKWVERWGISTAHFDPQAVRNAARRRRRKPLEEILVADSTFHRGHLKRRLYQEGIKERRCELCGQDEIWNGRRMALILDHVNGIPTDNRLANLRIVCANCAATLETHCGRNGPRIRACARCGEEFEPRNRRQRHCSFACGSRHDRSHLRGPRPNTRKVERPPYERLIAEVEELGWLGTGRKYGVSDNAVRKWVRAYEREPAGGAREPE
jgi:hypothetical protein